MKKNNFFLNAIKSFFKKIFKKKKLKTVSEISDEKINFLIKEISEIDKTFSKFKLYSAVIYCTVNSKSILNIKKIENDMNDLKNFKCKFIEKGNEINIILMKKVGEK